MKILLTFFSVLLSISLLHAQWEQVGQDIDGEEAYDHSGYAVSINAEGDIMAVGSPFNDDGGEVRVFNLIENQWQQMGSSLIGEAVNDDSGSALSLNAEGTIIAVGAHYNNEWRGQVRVYEFIDDAWIQMGSDIDGNPAGEPVDDHFGISVDLSSDGLTLVAGAWGNDAEASNAGQVRVFEFVADEWVLKGSAINGEFGYSEAGHGVSISSDGQRIAFSSPGNYGGRVRIFEYSVDDWIQLGNSIDGEVNTDMSTPVDLNAEGSVVVIGAKRNDDGGTDAGQARVFQYKDGEWTQKGEDFEGEASYDRLGYSVSLNGVGDIVAISAPSRAYISNNTGYVRLFQFINESWHSIGDIYGEHGADWSGSSICLSESGDRVAIGAEGNVDNGTSAGHIRVFECINLKANQLESEKEESLKVFPNPTNGFVNIEANQIQNIQVINSKAQVLVEKNQIDKLDLSSLDAGIYYIKVITKNSVFTQRILLND